MQTGQPGPGTSSMSGGKALRRPIIAIDRSWPPHTFITLNRRGSFSARRRSSHCRVVMVVAMVVGLVRFTLRVLRRPNACDLGAQPRLPSFKIYGLARRQGNHRRGIGEIANRLFRAQSVEIVHEGYQVYLGQQYKLGAPEYNRVFRRFVIAFRRREQDDIAMLTEVEARRA